MNILVQKFGGTSVATKEMRNHVLHHVQRELAEWLSIGSGQSPQWDGVEIRICNRHTS